MANQHWEILQSGRIKVPETPKELFDAACDYFMWCDMKPLVTKKTVTVGKEAGKKMEIETPRPYTIKGLCLHCGILEEYLHDIRMSKDQSNEYYVVVSRILYVIYVQNAELAMTGVYNSIFTSKLLGFANEDAPTAAVKVNIIGGVPALSTSENEILEKLEAEKQSGES